MRAITSAPAIVPSRAIWRSERMSIRTAPERIACWVWTGESLRKPLRAVTKSS
ncbi:MAG TPA: hypothetical protein VG268_15375 [Streptosporangiaceae bacterium]|nr:hypothetical protein [Streptosporangiaceae bacterium]